MGLACQGYVHYTVKSTEELEKEAVKGDTIIFGFWSWRIPDWILRDCNCISFHSSDLPKFKGGSPIQNQIMDGLTKTKLTAFKPNGTMDGGAIYYKEYLSLEGDISRIHDEIGCLIPIMVRRILKERMKPIPQKETGKIYPRRTPEQSEIKPKEMTAKDIYNLVRCLNMEPYPTAFIRGKDGKKVLIYKVEVEE